MSSERKALLEKAYPEVLTFCRGLGLVFEVVDLRWGIRSVSSGDHEACEVFLQEIQNCQRISAGPAFIVSLKFVKRYMKITPPLLFVFVYIAFLFVHFISFKQTIKLRKTNKHKI
uniref:Uncharacterized protein n=1 Tax=Labrus bergylta TaxID=56723 RepID=A0A3Q3GNP1_9LABR